MVEKLTEPPCGQCRPALAPENVPVVDLYSRCSDQWQQSSGGARIANTDIVAAMHAMQIDQADQLALFDEVKILIAEITTLLHREQRARQEQRTPNHGHPQGRSGRRR